MAKQALTKVILFILSHWNQQKNVYNKIELMNIKSKKFLNDNGIEHFFYA